VGIFWVVFFYFFGVFPFFFSWFYCVRFFAFCPVSTAFFVGGLKVLPLYLGFVYITTKYDEL
jgi:hypothetical protein